MFQFGMCEVVLLVGAVPEKCKRLTALV
jgi:hypothetical protein